MPKKSNKAENEKTGSGHLKRGVMRFDDLPLGTRFSYKEYPKIQYVILEHRGEDGCGKVAEWEGVKGPVATQRIFAAESSDDERKYLEVIVRA